VANACIEVQWDGNDAFTIHYVETNAEGGTWRRRATDGSARVRYAGSAVDPTATARCPPRRSSRRNGW
jgi:hypothetical protein